MTIMRMQPVKWNYLPWLRSGKLKWTCFALTSSCLIIVKSRSAKNIFKFRGFYCQNNTDVQVLKKFVFSVLESHFVDFCLRHENKGSWHESLAFHWMRMIAVRSILVKYTVEVPLMLLYMYRLGTVKSKSFVGKVLLRIKWKFELHYTL